MNNKHIQALELRKAGKTYNEISKELSVAKSTLSFWLKDNVQSMETKLAHEIQMRPLLSEKIGKINKTKSDQRENLYNNALEEGSKEFIPFQTEPLFIAGMSIYLALGDKNPDSNAITLRSRDPGVLKIFIRFCAHYLHLHEEKLKFWPLIPESSSITDVCEWWRTELNLSIDQFYKPQVLRTKKPSKRLLYGIGNIIIGSKLHKVKLLDWVKLAKVVLAE